MFFWLNKTSKSCDSLFFLRKIIQLPDQINVDVLDFVEHSEHERDSVF